MAFVKHVFLFENEISSKRYIKNKKESHIKALYLLPSAVAIFGASCETFSNLKPLLQLLSYPPVAP